MKYGSLFSGIGGIDLGLDRAGMTCAWQVENNEWCQKVLTKHWPDVPKFRDIREVHGRELEPVDLICGGFPCQDISYAGEGAGLSGARSGLWSEFKRIIRMVGPEYILVENVPALLSRGLGVVLGDLADLGYDAEWESIPAALFGAPHLRWRVFILAYTHGERRFRQREALPREFSPQSSGPKASIRRHDRQSTSLRHRDSRRMAEEQWRLEPRPCGVADGLPDGVDRLRGLGNAVVPQKAEWLGRLILEHNRAA
jgi:DNA (cytosine-5)-methyltransferase 1